MRTGTAVITRVLAIVFALGLVLLGPAALAHHKQGHTNGGGNSASAKKSQGGGKSADLPNEDTDTNDGGTDNNIVDGGDNMHPSGKDKSVEHGGSGNQGKSPSDPDGDSNGGADKPDQPGGVDLADQDGNNGCGNDDDFEDDNNGNCGGPEKQKKRPHVGEEEEEREKVAGDNEVTLRLPDHAKKSKDEVLGLVARRPVARKVIRTTERVEDRVEDRVLARAATTTQASAATLPFTGGDLAGFVAAGIGMLVAGAASLGITRRK